LTFCYDEFLQFKSQELVGMFGQAWAAELTIRIRKLEAALPPMLR
jgi:hypothetical protein